MVWEGHCWELQIEGWSFWCKAVHTVRAMVYFISYLNTRPKTTTAMDNCYFNVGVVYMFFQALKILTSWVQREFWRCHHQHDKNSSRRCNQHKLAKYMFCVFFVSLLVFCAKSRTCADRNTPHGLFNFCHDGWQHVRNTCFFCCLNIPIVWILQSSWFNAFFFGGWRCDGCEKRFEPGTMLWRCEICVVDFCASDFRFRKFQKQVILESILEPPDHLQ